MALRRELTKRLLTATSSPHLSLRRHYISSSPDAASRGFFRRILQRRTLLNHSSSSFHLPIGDALRERLSEMTMHIPMKIEEEERVGLVTVEDVKRIVRAAQLEKVKQRLRSVPETAVSYDEFVGLCVEACGGRRDQGLEFARVLDDTANVVVLGSLVFLRPDQIAKTMEDLIRQSWAGPNDPRRKELEEMEKEKAQIDKRAENEVRRELYGGLGLMVAQTMLCMRLTFWELSWDVMEPVCFFVASTHFVMAYTFFLRTSTEPTFEGFFRRRFRTKQAKIMRLCEFDVERYKRLSKALYPSRDGCW